MSRPFSSAARRAAYGQQTGDGYVMLITITHESLAEPIRVASGAASGHTTDNRGNPVGYTDSRGNRFIEYPFDLQLPEDTDEEAVTARIEIDNVDRLLVQMLREAFGTPNVLVEIVMGRTPDTVEAGPYNFSLKQADYTALTISGQLGFEVLLNESYPYDSFTPATMPGVF